MKIKQGDGHTRYNWRMKKGKKQTKKKKVNVKGPTLKELVAGIRPEDRHPEVDWGKPRGKEVW